MKSVLAIRKYYSERLFVFMTLKQLSTYQKSLIISSLENKSLKHKPQQQKAHGFYDCTGQVTPTYGSLRTSRSYDLDP
jgi:hypothetical protein